MARRGRGGRMGTGPCGSVADWVSRGSRFRLRGFPRGRITGIPDAEYEQLFRKRNGSPGTFWGVPQESLDQKLARFVRQQRGTLTFKQFARKLGLSESTLHRIENGQQSATLRAVQQILRVLRCDYEDVFGDPASQLRAAETASSTPSGGGDKPTTVPYPRPRRKR